MLAQNTTQFQTAVALHPQDSSEKGLILNGQRVVLRPLVLSVPDCVCPGYMFRVKGLIPTGSNRFSINFQCGAEPGEKSNIALHIDFRFKYANQSNAVICNTYTGIWETEEVHHDMPLTVGERFDVLFECKKDRFKITVNGKHYTDYKYRMPLDSISHLSVLNDAMPIEVYCGDETQINEQQAIQQQQQQQQRAVQQQAVQQQQQAFQPQQQAFQQQRQAFQQQQQAVQQQQQAVQQQQQAVQQQANQQQQQQRQQRAVQQQEQAAQQQVVQQLQQRDVQQQQQGVQQQQQGVQHQQQGVQQQQQQQTTQQQQQITQQHQQGIHQEDDAMFQCSPYYWKAPKDWIIVMPLMSPILEGVSTGMSFNVQGVAPSGSSRFSVNLLHGFDFANTEVVFVLEFRFDYAGCHNVVVRNSRGDSWGTEERDGGMPLSKQQPFDILIVCEETFYKVLIDGKHFTNFNHRIPVSRVTHLAVFGDVMLSYAGNNLPYNMIKQ